MIYFHIGYPKAGSSVLQKQFFSLHPEINFLGRYPVANIGISTKPVKNSAYPKDQELIQFHNNLVTQTNFDTKANHELIEKRIKNSGNSKKINLLSSEFVTSIFFSLPNIDEKLRRLKNLKVNSVIIILRNQVDLIKSQYREHPFDPEDLVHGKPMTLDEWVEKADLLDYSYLDSLNFYKQIKVCQDIFGSEQVIPLLFEDMVYRPERFTTKLCAKTGLDFDESLMLIKNLKPENTGVSLRYNRIRKLKKRLIGEFPISRYIPPSVFRSLKSIMKKGKKAEYDFSDSTRSFLIDRFGRDNQSLQKEFNLPLSEFQYPL